MKKKDAELLRASIIHKLRYEGMTKENAEREADKQMKEKRAAG